jgi:ubiquinone/menaquinone biosynthesis C-methylase UbiE
MKKSDYAPRATAFDSYLEGKDLVGVEVGCDVGAHAQALLEYCPVEKLYLIDIWERDFYRGYCYGRIESLGFKSKVEFIHGSSAKTFERLKDKGEVFDFVYVDIVQEYNTIKEALNSWWELLKKGGVMGCRSYSPSNVELTKAVDEFVKEKGCDHIVERYHGEMIMFK